MTTLKNRFFKKDNNTDESTGFLSDTDSYDTCDSNDWTNFVIKTQNKPWNYDELSNNPNVTWELVQALPDKPWNYYFLSSNPNITWDIIQSNPYKPWNFYELSKNPNIIWDNVNSHWFFLPFGCLFA